MQLDPGDTLLLLTDGVLDARHEGECFDIEGIERVLAAGVSSARAAADGLEQAVLAYTGGTLGDDMAAVDLHMPRDVRDVLTT